MRKRDRLSGVAATACLAMLSFAASAEMPDLDVLRHARIVPDHELAEMHGRFVSAGSVTFFGLQLYTAWQTGDGQIMSTAMSLGVNFSGGGGGAPSDARVLAHFFREAEAEPGAPPPEPLLPLPQSESFILAPDSAGAGGLEKVDGIVQSNQLAGNRNGSRNQIRIDVIPNPGAVGPLTPIGPLGEPIEISETTVAVSENGTVQSAILEQDTLGVAIEVPGHGAVLQRVRGSQMGQIAQHVRLTSSFNEIANLMQITFQVASVGSATQANILSALDHLRGLR